MAAIAVDQGDHVNIAIADMAMHHHPRMRNGRQDPGLDIGSERGLVLQRNHAVVRHHIATALVAFGHAVPHRPDRLGLGQARCQHGILGQACIHRLREHGGKRLVKVDPGQRVGQFDDQVPRRGELEGNGDMRHGRSDRLDLAA